MKRRILSFLLLSSVTLAASFSGFSIKPYGDQTLDLPTGVTTLDKGGVVTDAEHGVTIDAQFVELKEGDFLKAREAKLRGNTVDGVLTATNLDYRVKTGLLNATGTLTYSDKLVKNLKAKTGTLDLKKQFLVITGGVSSDSPAISGNTLLVDYDTRTAVLQGHYKYSFEGTQLSGKTDKSILFVSWNAQGKMKAISNPKPEQLKGYAAYLK
jgi:hypothetical protein